MNIITQTAPRSLNPFPAIAKPATPTLPEADKSDLVTLGSWLPTPGLSDLSPMGFYAAVGLGAGVYAGLSSGILPAIAGGAAGAGLGIICAASSARAGFTNQSFLAGLAGLAGGAAGGAYLGYAQSGPWAAAALGATGAVGFAAYRAFAYFD